MDGETNRETGRSMETDVQEPSDATLITVRTSSMIDSFRGCGLSGSQIDTDDLRDKISMPQYLREALRRAILSREISTGVFSAQISGVSGAKPPENPIVVFINSRSGGRHGPELKNRLQHLMGEEQVFDLSTVKPHEFVEYGLGCLEQLAIDGDNCAKEIRQKLRIVVAGGDGTVGWILGSLGVLQEQAREPVPPVAIIPLGTGNDLSRSFGWGGSFPFAWKSAVKRSLTKACSGPICRLDSWQVSVTMPAGELVDIPHSLRRVNECNLDQDLEAEGPMPEIVTCYEGVFYNYFSIGMDAQVAYGFHHLRNDRPYLAQGPISNKLIYSGYSCTQGWFFTPCVGDPSLRGLRNVLRIHIKKVNGSEWEQIRVPSKYSSTTGFNCFHHLCSPTCNTYNFKRGEIGCGLDWTWLNH